MQKLKDARSEAAKEIEAYRTQKDKEFEQYEKEVGAAFVTAGILSAAHTWPPTPPQHKSQTSDNQSSIDSSTTKQIDGLKTSVAKNRDGVVDKILERVVTCEPKLHRNLKKIEA